MTATPTAEAYCEDLLRRFDRDHYLSTLFVPAESRADIRALFAFDVELKRVRDLVSEPLPGEVRLQWWHDVVEGEERGGALGNPVAAELLRAIGRHGLPRSAFTALIDARVQDLYDDPAPTMTDLEGALGETNSALLRLSSLILSKGGDAGTAEAAGHGGVAEGLAGLLRDLPADLRRGRVRLPIDLLDRHGLTPGQLTTGASMQLLAPVRAELTKEARHHLASARQAIDGVPAALRSAFLPIALVGPLLDRIERSGADLPNGFEIPQWQRQWHLWRAARRWG